jgi:hypothetical protein
VAVKVVVLTVVLVVELELVAVNVVVLQVVQVPVVVVDQAVAEDNWVMWRYANMPMHLFLTSSFQNTTELNKQCANAFSLAHCHIHKLSN